MARRRKMSGYIEERDDPTLLNPEKSEALAMEDQKEAEVRGEANPPPSAVFKAETKKAPTKPPGKVNHPKVALRVFIASGGIRWDQMAGFKSYAQRTKMGPMSIPDWRKAFTEFMQRPV